MSKELYFTDGNNEVKYLDTTASFNLAITQDGSAFDLTNAKSIDVKVANDTGYVFDKSIDMATIKQPLAGLITMPVDAEVMNALVPDDYTIEVWVTLSSLITPGSQEGLTDGAITSTTTDTTTYNAIFPSDDPQGFTITENVMSDSGDVIPIMSLDEFQQEFDQLKTDLTNKVSTLKGPKGDTGQGLEIKGKVDTTSQLPKTASEGDGYLVAEELYVWTNNAWKDCGTLQGPQGVQGKTGTGISSTTIQYQISNSLTTAPTGTWSNSIVATTTANPHLWMKATLNYTDGTTKDFYLVSQKGDKGDKGATGATGPIGPRGPVGAGLVVKGTVKDTSQLPKDGNQEGYCYFIGTDLYVWDSGAWKNCGSVSPNLSNYVTVTDLNNGLSTKVNTTDMRKPANDVLGLEDIKSSILPNGTDLYTLINTSGKPLSYHVPTYVSAQSMVNKPTTNLSAFKLNTAAIGDRTSPNYNYTFLTLKNESDGSIYEALIYTNGSGAITVARPWYKVADDSTVVHTTDMRKPASDVAGIEEVNAKQDKIGYTPADDSKVAHLSGANNFDTVPTVNNNPVLLASSLPSDIARTTKDVNFTGKLQKSGIDVATKSDVTTAVSTATANMVDSSKPTNFTAGLQSGGVDVATAADLKSVEDSAWRPLTLKNSTSGTILFKDNGNGTASLTGTANFHLASGGTTWTPCITPPTGYTFTSLKWGLTFVMYNEDTSRTSSWDVSLSNGDICFSGNDSTITFSPSELTTSSGGRNGNPALVSISKV